MLVENASCTECAPWLQVVAGEVQTIVAAMCICSPTAISSYGADTSQGPSARHGDVSSHLLKSFALLRATLENPSSAEMDPMIFLRPFLEVVRTDEASGPITSIALSSLHKFIVYGFIPMDAATASQAINGVVETVVRCRPDSSDGTSDEVVQGKVLQVLLAAFQSDVGELLGNDMICAVFDAFLRMSLQKGTSVLLKSSAQACLETFVDVLFTRPFHHVGAMHHPHDLKGSYPDSRSRGYPAPSALRDGVGSLSFSADEGAEYGVHGSYDYDGLYTVLSKIAALLIWNEPVMSESREARTVRKVLRGSDARRVVGLLLAAAILRTCSPDAAGLDSGVLPLLFGSPRTVQLLVGEFCRRLLALVRSENTDVLSLALSVLTEYFSNVLLLPHTLVQRELFLQTVFQHVDDLLEVVKMTLEGSYGGGDDSAQLSLCHHKLELIIDTLYDLCNTPDFLLTLFVNYDCSLYRSELFEDLCKCLSKTSFPQTETLFPFHRTAFQALVLIANLLASRFRGHDASGLHRFQTTASITRSDHGDRRSLARSAGNRPSPPPRRRSPHPQRSRSPHVDTVPALVQESRITVSESAVLPIRRDHQTSLGGLAVTPGAVDQVFAGLERKRSFREGVQLFHTASQEGIKHFVAMGLLPVEMPPRDIAELLRFGRGLCKSTIAGLLCSTESYAHDALMSLCGDFCNMEGLPLDTALRILFAHLTPAPGDNRYLELLLHAFSSSYFAANSGERALPYKSENTVYALAAAVCVLSSTVHQDHKHGDEALGFAEWQELVEGVNEGADLPSRHLQGLYESVLAEPIVPRSGNAVALHYQGLWEDALQQPSEAEWAVPTSSLYCPEVGRQMFLRCWGSVTSAMSIVLEKADPATTNMCLEGLSLCGRIAVLFDLCDVFDNIVVTLCKFSSLLPTVGRASLYASAGGGWLYTDHDAVISFADNRKAQAVCETLFELVNHHGHVLRESWRSVLQCILTLRRMEVVPKGILEDEDFYKRKEPLPEKQKIHEQLTHSGGWLSWLSGRSSIQGVSGPSPQFKEAFQLAYASVEKCDLQGLVLSTTEVQADSLVYLAKALIIASVRSQTHRDLENALGSAASPPRALSPSDGGNPSARTTAIAQEEDGVVFSLRLLCTITVLNVDRIYLLWMLVHEHLRSLLAPFLTEAHHASLVATPPVVAAVTSILFLASRLFHLPKLRKDLLQQLSWVSRLPDGILAQMQSNIGEGVDRMINRKCTFLVNPSEWDLVVRILRSATISHESYGDALDRTLGWMDRGDDVVKPASVNAFLKLLYFFASSDGAPRQVVTRAMEAAYTLYAEVPLANKSAGDLPAGTLCFSDSARGARREGGGPTGSGGQSVPLSAESSQILWVECVRPYLVMLVGLLEGRSFLIRSAALNHLQRALLLPRLQWLQCKEWRCCFQEVVIPVLQRLSIRGGKPPGVDRAGVGASRLEWKEQYELYVRGTMLVSKVFLRHLPILSEMPEFSSLWMLILSYFQQCDSSRENIEMATEALKNMILVMATSGFFTPPDGSPGVPPPETCAQAAREEAAPWQSFAWVAASRSLRRTLSGTLLGDEPVGAFVHVTESAPVVDVKRLTASLEQPSPLTAGSEPPAAVPGNLPHRPSSAGIPDTHSLFGSSGKRSDEGRCSPRLSPQPQQGVETVALLSIRPPPDAVWAYTWHTVDLVCASIRQDPSLLGLLSSSANDTGVAPRTPPKHLGGQTDPAPPSPASLVMDEPLPSPAASKRS
eukprot:CAMPEP_0119128316 /NCGR_PEP_ID=MMETSP1310-20130426/6523_1 /TAXON_ID=464262 /ORGANISM="Genus nov. species nov., Strain RCC2339" /LENGTH=1743 /DNA_ID=CAMNT_0007118647 /DNA_START=195 /DNA_END=5422 /DNA_ORIENTATION=-